MVKILFYIIFVLVQYMCIFKVLILFGKSVRDFILIWDRNSTQTQTKCK